MAYVIAEPCIGTKDTACVDACPVDCIAIRKLAALGVGCPLKTVLVNREQSRSLPISRAGCRHSSCFLFESGRLPRGRSSWVAHGQTDDTPIPHAKIRDATLPPSAAILAGELPRRKKAMSREVSVTETPTFDLNHCRSASMRLINATGVWHT